MNELDFLKKTWNTEQKFPKISKDDIMKMIHKKSSSIVLWIFIISIIEFVLLNFVSLFLFNDTDTTNIEKSYLLELIFKNIDYISGAISLVFILIFYYKYKSICVANNTKKLMEQILQTKKIVNYYITINITLVLIIFFIAAIVTLQTEGSHEDYGIKFYIVSIGLFLLICGLFFGLIWLYYRIIYGILIKRLMKNYHELERIEQ